MESGLQKEDLDPPEGRVTLDTDGPIATITIRRPEKHNALSLHMWRELLEAARTADANQAIRVVIVRGEGQEAFSAGADISEFAAVRQGAERARRYSEVIQLAERALIESRKPSIAMLHGICAGGGSGIALACSLRFCDTEFRFAIPAARLGVVYHQTAVERLVQHVGPSVATDILSSARFVTVEEAHARGLVDAIYPPDRLEEEVYRYACDLARRAPISIEGARVGVQAALNPHDEDLRREVIRMQQIAHESADYREGVQAFLEKRPPVFGAGAAGEVHDR